MYWFYTNLLITNWVRLVPAQLKQSKNPQQTNPTLQLRLNKQNKKTLKKKQGPRQIQDQDLLENFLKRKKFIYLNSM